MLEIAAVDNEVGALFDAEIDVALDACLACASPVTSGPKSAEGSVDGPTFSALHPRDQRLDQTIGRLLPDGYRHGDGHAAFAGGAVTGADQRIDGLVHVGIGHDDHVVLGAAETLHALAVVAAPAE